MLENLPASVLMIPLILQGILIAFDEFYFHWKRGLGRWERLGHPLDTLFLIVCAVFAYASSWQGWSIPIFIALAIGSSIFVTKDEWVHQRESSGTEAWLHAIMFQLHPVALIAIGLLGYGSAQGIEGYPSALAIQIGIMCTFGLYQFIYWNLIRSKRIDESVSVQARSSSS